VTAAMDRRLARLERLRPREYVPVDTSALDATITAVIERREFSMLPPKVPPQPCPVTERLCRRLDALARNLADSEP
jgi:hypothetical protein